MLPTVAQRGCLEDSPDYPIVPTTGSIKFHADCTTPSKQIFPDTVADFFPNPMISFAVPTSDRLVTLCLCEVDDCNKDYCSVFVNNRKRKCDNERPIRIVNGVTQIDCFVGNEQDPDANKTKTCGQYDAATNRPAGRCSITQGIQLTSFA